MPEHWPTPAKAKDWQQPYRAGDFCNTNRQAYDVVVMACLVVIKHCMGEDFAVSSDGDTADWQDGLELAKRVTGLKSLVIPAGIRPAQARDGRPLELLKRV